MDVITFYESPYRKGTRICNTVRVSVHANVVNVLRTRVIYVIWYVQRNLIHLTSSYIPRGVIFFAYAMCTGVPTLCMGSQ